MLAKDITLQGLYPMLWQIRKLTNGSDQGKFHSHSYYDIPVLDASSRWLAAYETTFANRKISLNDRVTVGIVDTDASEENWKPIGSSGAWSWQQGPMAQFVPNSKRVIWNDREDGRLNSRMHDLDTGQTRTLPAPAYALAPCGLYAFSLNFERLDRLRPGYGYAPENKDSYFPHAPADDGIWKVDLQTGDKYLILSLRDAAKFLARQLGLKFAIQSIAGKFYFWFNHIKFSPSGHRFTVKLRFRSVNLSKPWNDIMGVSLTADSRGGSLRYLARGTSHVIWQSDENLYLWQQNGLYNYADEKTGGRRVSQIVPDIINHNVHARHLPEDFTKLIFDTPYRETVDLNLLDRDSGRVQHLASFGNHVPPHGEFRCDLHPVPSPDSQKIIVTSMKDGGRQVYCLFRKHEAGTGESV